MREWRRRKRQQQEFYRLLPKLFFLPLTNDDKAKLLQLVKEQNWEEAVNFANFLIEKLLPLVEMEEAAKKAQAEALKERLEEKAVAERVVEPSLTLPHGETQRLELEKPKIKKVEVKT